MTQLLSTKSQNTLLEPEPDATEGPQSNLNTPAALWSPLISAHLAKQNSTGSTAVVQDSSAPHTPLTKLIMSDSMEMETNSSFQLSDSDSSEHIQSLTDPTIVTDENSEDTDVISISSSSMQNLLDSVNNFSSIIAKMGDNIKTNSDSVSAIHAKILGQASADGQNKPPGRFHWKPCTEVNELNAEFKSKFVEWFVKVHGAGFMRRRGQTVLLKIIQMIIKPQLFTKFSWTGASRGAPRGSKLAFKQYTNIYEALCEIVDMNDPGFPNVAVSDFLRGCCKNSKSRLRSKNLRNPAQRAYRIKLVRKAPIENQRATKSNEGNILTFLAGHNGHCNGSGNDANGADDQIAPEIKAEEFHNQLGNQ